MSLFFALFVLSHFIFLFFSQLLKSPVDRLNYLVSRTVVPFIFRFCLFFIFIVSDYRLIYFSFDSFLFSYSFIYFFILALRHSFFIVIFLSVFIFLSCFVVTHSHPPFIPVFDLVSSPLLASSHFSYTFPHRILSFTLFFSILCLAVLPWHRHPDWGQDVFRSNLDGKKRREWEKTVERWRKGKIETVRKDGWRLEGECSVNSNEFVF